MRDLPALDGDVVELDGRGLLRGPRARRLPHARRRSAATASTSSRSAPAARATRSCTRRAAASSRPSARRAPPARTACAPRSSATARWMLARGHDDVRGEVRLRARPRHRARVAARDPRRPAASRPGSARTPSRRSSTTPTRTSTSRSPRCCPKRPSSPRRRTCSSSAARSTRRRRAGTSRRAATPGLALRLHGDQFTESGAIPLAIELGARSVDHLEATGDDGIRALAASDVVGVLLPASALFLDRPMPPARALVDAGAAIALATDFNPGSAFCESLPLVCSLAARSCSSRRRRRSAPARSTPPTCSGEPTASAGSRPATAPTSSLLDAPDWRYLAYHLGGRVVARVGRRRGELR